MPWSVPAVLGVIGGILLALGLPWGAAVPLAGAALALLDARLPLLVVALLGGGAGWLSAHTVLSRPEPLTPWLGAQVTLKGEWDGQFLTLHDPRARLAVSPKPTQGPGQLEVAGRLVAPQGRRTPGGFDQAGWLRSQGGLFVPTPGAVLVGARVKTHQPEGGLRGWFRQGLSAGLSERQAALMQAVELGDRSDISQEDFAPGYAVRDAFARAGLAHLMALSGQNVALITGVLVWLLIRAGAAPAWRYGLPAALLLPYLLLLVQPSPSITRAVIMGAAVLLALALGRGRPDPLGLIALAALACLLLFPLWLLDVGFQLSFLAVLALTQTPRVAERLPARWPHALRLAISATVLAELGTLPVVAGSFGQLPLVGLPANLVAGVIMAALVPLGFVAGLLGPLAAPLNVACGLLASALLAVAEAFGRAPVLTWGAIGAAGVVAYATALGAGWLWLLGRVRARAALGTLLAGLLLTALPGWLRPAREVVFLDVGQGDSTLIRLPGLTMLIDAGGSVGSNYDVGGRTVVPALRALGVRKLDVLVATHADTDHIEGVPAVLRALPVGELWVGHRKRGDPVLDAVLAEAQAQGVPVREVRRGDRVQASGATLTVLWPPGNHWQEEDNENSVALTLESRGWRAAFLGDLAQPGEAQAGPGNLDLLKAAHHGSRHSSGEALLAQATPADTVISVGRNTYGHPHPDVLARLAQVGSRVWRTDQVGTIRWPVP
ncbi:DNA internalization-related competence protein ComEC/Rec2 [Deinococcus multiflagellatus]|uniref:DNA internalization-related competence protein ComEC/Rec2 n=1 Tax=Deinococcus multiflagellatus TaxID=1656887 RepID=UPI001CCDEC22|nr:DNA internalization-related competence protein ComEC/Rec2 [Deinococcus multiflagellatus]MBZ9713142.1 DNA internalization-related competence protein ComEC/Rec2 [Deinococcus multiflagellatus]